MVIKKSKPDTSIKIRKRCSFEGCNQNVGEGFVGRMALRGSSAASRGAQTMYKREEFVGRMAQRWGGNVAASTGASWSCPGRILYHTWCNKETLQLSGSGIPNKPRLEEYTSRMARRVNDASLRSCKGGSLLYARR